MNTLHDSMITDVVIRSLMHREILTDINQKKTPLTLKEILPDEGYREDLVSHRLYSRSDLDWLVDLIAGREDRLQSLPVGKQFAYPSISYIRNILRKYLNKS